MNDNGVAFNQNAKIMASDENHYEIMMHRYHSSMQNAEKSASLYSDLNLERQRAFYIKDKSLKKLDRLLVEFASLRLMASRLTGSRCHAWWRMPRWRWPRVWILCLR